MGLTEWLVMRQIDRSAEDIRKTLRENRMSPGQAKSVARHDPDYKKVGKRPKKTKRPTMTAAQERQAIQRAKRAEQQAKKDERDRKAAEAEAKRKAQLAAQRKKRAVQVANRQIEQAKRRADQQEKRRKAAEDRRRRGR